MNTDLTTVRLPHTGLRVPDRSLSVTGYKEMTTSNGVAFTAKLRRNNQIVGVIENHGTGGMTFFYAGTPAVFGETHLEAYAAQCRNEDGGTVNAETLLDELVEEADWARQINRLGKRGLMPLRLLDATSEGYRPYSIRSGHCAIPRSDREWVALGAEIGSTTAMRPADKQWWQGWNRVFWRDITARPPGIDPALFG